mmetsp:Transcript_1356/g.2830  ORF Transcript_1356/g.2830 Transcript_1356/m.2830 type:complete len:186 (-) Transcript_1356:1400-1957(-)
MVPPFTAVLLLGAVLLGTVQGFAPGSPRLIKRSVARSPRLACSAVPNRNSLFARPAVAPSVVTEEGLAVGTLELKSESTSKGPIGKLRSAVSGVVKLAFRVVTFPVKLPLFVFRRFKNKETFKLNRSDANNCVTTDECEVTEPEVAAAVSLKEMELPQKEEVEVKKGRASLTDRLEAWQAKTFGI